MLKHQIQQALFPLERPSKQDTCGLLTTGHSLPLVVHPPLTCTAERCGCEAWCEAVTAAQLYDSDADDDYEPSDAESQQSEAEPRQLLRTLNRWPSSRGPLSLAGTYMDMHKRSISDLNTLALACLTQLYKYIEIAYTILS